MGESIRTAEDLEDLLVRALGDRDTDAWETIADELCAVRSFRDAGLPIKNRGVVVRAASGAEFRLIITRSERADARAYFCPECGAEREGREEFLRHLTAGHGWSAADAMDEIGIPIQPRRRTHVQAGQKPCTGCEQMADVVAKSPETRTGAIPDSLKEGVGQ